VDRYIEDIGICDGGNHDERHHQRLHPITENEPSPTGARLGKKA
jgi:hypothetical protein